jgi:hypothetical protein
MKPLDIQEHILLTLVAEGAKPGWLVDTRFGEDMNIVKFKSLIKNYKNKDGEKIYKNLEFNDRIPIVYNKLLTTPKPPKNGEYYTDIEIGIMLGFTHPIDLAEKLSDEYYSIHLIAILKNEAPKDEASSLEELPPIVVNKKDFQDIDNNKNIVIQITATLVPKDVNLNEYEQIVEKYKKAISESKNDYLKEHLLSKDFIRYYIQKNYTSAYLTKKLLSKDKLTKDEEIGVKFILFNTTGWEKGWHFDFDFNNKTQRFLIVNAISFIEKMEYDYDKYSKFEDDFIDLLKISTI